jgi:hypothetical protein
MCKFPVIRVNLSKTLVMNKKYDFMSSINNARRGGGTTKSKFS